MPISPVYVATDAAGNAYFTSHHCVFRLDQNGTVTRVAGNGRWGYSGDGGPATSAQLSYPNDMAVDGTGNLFIADSGNHRIRKVSLSGTIATVAGGGTADLGDGGPATSAQLKFVAGLAVDGAGNLFFDTGNRIRRVSLDGIITTVAGNGTWGFSGDGGPATSAQLGYQTGLAVDGAGNLFIADSDNHRIRKVSPTGVITTVAGGGTDFPGDGGPATSAQLRAPWRVAVDDAGNFFFVDSGKLRIRKVSPRGIITTVAGNGFRGLSGDGGPGTSAQLSYPNDVAVDGAGNLFIADSGNGRIRKVSPSGIITTAAGNGTFLSFSGDGGPATGAQLGGPSGVAVDGEGNLFIADSGNHRIRKVSVSGIITTVAGDGTPEFSGDGGPATSAQLYGPRGVAVDRAGNLLIADIHRIRKVSPKGLSKWDHHDNGGWWHGGPE